VSQPSIGQNGVVNQASQIPSTLASGSLARGAAFTIRGVHLGPDAVVWLRKGTGSTRVRVLASSAQKIDAVLPETAPIGPALIVVSSGGSESKPFSVQIAASNPGIFSVNQRGWGPGRIENLDSLGKRTLNSTSNPAHPGQRVALRITGLGKDAPAPLVIGGRAVQSGLPRTLPAPGEQEISFLIPQGVPSGCYVPVYFRGSGGRLSNVVTMAIRPGSGSCEAGPIPLLDKQRIGLAVFTRSSMLDGAISTTEDEVIAVFAAKNEGPPVSPLLLLPPPGTCTAYTSSFQTDTIRPDSLASALIAELGGQGLAAGSELSAVQGKYHRDIPGDRGSAGYYRARLGSYRNKPKKLLLEPGKFVFSSKGGTDVGAFSLSVESPAPFEWVNRGQIYLVDRNHALPITWRKQAGDHMTIILATNVDQVTTAIGTCLCTAPLGATRFEIPAGLLANIPASATVSGIPYDQLFVASLPVKGAQHLQAPGIASGAVLTIFASGRFVKYH
jgi:uncharacterized protein (TIGR03437 family)